MKHRVIVIVICVLFSSKGTFAQFVRWGKSEKLPSQSYHQKFLGVGKDESFYVLRRNKTRSFQNEQRVWIETYDQQANLIKHIEINAPSTSDDYKVYLEDVFFFQGEFKAFYSLFSKSDSNLIALVNKIGLNGEISPCDTLMSVKSPRILPRTFQFQKSKDKSKLLFYHNQLMENEKLDRYCYLLDRELDTPLLNGKIKTVFDNRSYELKKIRVRNNGDLVFLGRKYYPKSDIQKVNYHYDIRQYQLASDRWIGSKLMLDSIFISSCNMELDESNNQMILAGFYSPKSQFRIRGVFYSRYDFTTNQILGLTREAFSDGFIAGFQHEVIKKKPDQLNYIPELIGFELDKIQLRSDGGIVLFSEYFNEYTSSYRQVDANGHFSMHQDYHYDFKSLIVTNIHPNGKVFWSRQVPKLQTTLNDGGMYSSYFYYPSKAKLNFIFNDHVKNEGRITKLWPMNNPKKAIISLVQLDVKGGISKKNLFEQTKKQMLLRSVMCEQISAKKLLIYTESKKKYQYGILDL